MSATWWIIISIIGWGIGSVFYKLAGDNLHPFMVSAVVSCLFAVLTPLVFWLIPFDKTIHWNGVAYALVGGLFMCVGSMGYLFAMKNGVPVGRATILTSLYPILTLIISVFLFKEQIDFKKGIGIALAVLGFVLINMK